MPKIILWENYLVKRRKWILTILSISALSFFTVGVMYHQTQAQVRNIPPTLRADSRMQERYSEFKLKEDIYQVLRDKRIDLADGLEIAQAIIEESKRTDIPMKMFLGIMRQESNFSVNAVSDRKAMGIMQIHPATWKGYARKLNIPPSHDEAFKPSVNIRVSASILQDLKEKYTKLGYEEPEVWDYVLSAYYAGEGSVRSGLTKEHRRYVKTVKKFVGEYGRVIDG